MVKALLEIGADPNDRTPCIDDGSIGCSRASAHRGGRQPIRRNRQWWNAFALGQAFATRGHGGPAEGRRPSRPARP
jgi:hypothetical protein